MNSHQRRKSRRAVERGFGPRHAFNAQEGDELVPEELPGPPAEDLRIKRNSMGNLRPANLLKALGGELGSLSKEDVAKLGISLLMGGEGPEPLPPSAKVKQPGLKVHDPAPRYEGPPEATEAPGELWAKWLASPKGTEIPPELAGKVQKWPPPDNTFPSLNKPPYDALKEPIGGEAKDPSFSPEEVQKMEDLKDFLKPPKGPPAFPPSKFQADWQTRYDRGLLPPPEEFKRGTTGVRHNPKTLTGRPKKIGVDRGFGPRHAANAKEGEDLTQVNTDTVPAMLTPREAVLNRNAAELAGRPNIEALNEQGNELAKQGVDLASGESNVPDPKAGDRRLAGGGAESALLRQLYEKYGNLVPEYLLYPDVLNEIQNQGIGDPQMAQRGTANMKPKPKTPPSKPKPAPKPVKPTAPPSGSPYVQGFQKLMPQGLQGGGYADQMPGYQPRDFPHPMAGKMHPPPATLGGYQPQPLQQYEPQPLQGVGATLGQPYQGLKGLGSGSFFPKGGQGYADGTTDVTPPIGAANTSAAYGPPIQLTAPDISKILQLEGQKQGLTSSQVAGLAKAFQGLGQGGGSPGGGDLPYDELGGQYASFSGGYQGGISDIGYPPGIAPNADFSYTEGGWTGPLDPRWSSPGYARGSDDIEPGILGGNRDPDSWLSQFPPGVTVFGGRHPGSGFINRSSFNPGGSFGGAPGMPWSPTKIPTTYDPQGYPYGVPVLSPDVASAGPHPHTPPKSNS